MVSRGLGADSLSEDRQFVGGRERLRPDTLQEHASRQLGGVAQARTQLGAEGGVGGVAEGGVAQARTQLGAEGTVT